MPKNPAQKRAPVSQIKKTQEFTNRRPRVILDYFSVASCAERSAAGGTLCGYQKELQRQGSWTFGEAHSASVRRSMGAEHRS